MDIMKEANNVINKMSKEDLKENVMQQFKGHFFNYWIRVNAHIR